jgi:hypothetical protein
MDIFSFHFNVKLRLKLKEPRQITSKISRRVRIRILIQNITELLLTVRGCETTSDTLYSEGASESATMVQFFWKNLRDPLLRILLKDMLRQAKRFTETSVADVATGKTE